ncbi:MAG: pectinesterase family protein [Nitrospiraceae bacterium]
MRHAIQALTGRVFAAVLVGLVGLSSAAFAEETPAESKGPRTIHVALDGSGDYRSIQQAVDAAGKGDTVLVHAGAYPEDVTIHSKDRLKLMGEGADKVTILGRERVGVFHVGKWPYGATNIEISGMTINEHGGHALGMFNGRGITLRELKIKGMLFAQQVQDVRVERCDIGGSETTSVQFADSQGVVIGNYIHDSDHGVNVAGKSVVRIERNLITRQLFDAVVVMDAGQAELVNNTFVKNGGGASFLSRGHSEASGNIVSGSQTGFTVAPATAVTFSHNALWKVTMPYARPGPPPTASADLAPANDFSSDPKFVDVENGDVRLRADSPLAHVEPVGYLGAFAPAIP